MMDFGQITLSDLFLTLVSVIGGGLFVWKVVKNKTNNKNTVKGNTSGGNIAGGNISTVNKHDVKHSKISKNNNVVKNNSASGDIAGGDIEK